ncbi:T9SS type A sorting domain-containing protein [Pontibacter flavimaris]|uniref:Secretion system C-terminal sorting domain-containing protein n=1 Tax=Pontibacter flavimaris TaxID=1797110 RepID=A0A1Q5PCM5_9BACT|nr:T9SS type A sorting domain-containing protein [Pontibacter flavimaris]OKL40010.1 hypothetical protein A3841_16745 [Pontibacter flavimaris]
MQETSTRFKQCTRLVLLTLVYLLTQKPVFSQVPDLEVWDKSFGGWGMDKLTAMAPTVDGGYVLGGYTTSGTGGDLTVGNKGYRSYWIIKVSSTGSKTWDKTYGAGGEEYLTSLIATADGGYLAGGHSWSGATGDKTEGTRGNADFWIVKLDANGNKVWDKTYGGSLKDELSTMIQTPDGGYLVGGYSDSRASGDKTEGSKGYSDYWVIKLNADGSKAWDRTYGGSDSEYLTTLLNTPDGGYLLGGHSRSGADGDKSEPNKSPYGVDADYWVVKLDALGNKEWDKTIGGEHTDYLSTLTLLPDGGFLLGGSSNSEATGDRTEKNKGQYAFGNRLDYWIVKLSAKGEKMWDKAIGGSYEDQLLSVITTSDGGYLLGGWSSSGASSDKTDTSRGGIDYWVVKLDSERNKVWDKSFGGDKADYMLCMLATSDGGYLLGGHSTSGAVGNKTGSSRGAEDYWIVKLKETGTVRTSVVPVTKVWDKRFGGFYLDRLSSMVETTDGGYLLAGYSNSGKTGDHSKEYDWNIWFGYHYFWLVKVNADGTKVWDKAFGGYGHDALMSVVKTDDGGYLVGGYSNSGTSSDKSSSSSGNWDYWIIKLDAGGNKIWDRSFGGIGSNYFSTMILTPDGGFLLGGTTSSHEGGDKTETSRGLQDYWVVKIDRSGNKEWDKTIGGAREDHLTSLVASPDGGYLLGGYSSSGVGGDKTSATSGKWDYWVVKLNADGSKDWDRTIGGNGEDRLQSMLLLPDGNYLLGGYSDLDVGGSKTAPGKGSLDYWIVKLHASGYTMWDKTYGGHFADYLTNMVLTADGGVLLGGNSESEGDADKTEARRGVSWGDYWVVKLKSDGRKEWDKTFGGSGLENATALLETSDRAFLVGGYSEAGAGANGDRSQSAWGEADYWVVKFKSDLAVQLASEPAKASSVKVSEISTTSLKLTFAGGSGTKRLVLARQGAAVNAMPDDGFPYLSNPAFRQGQEIGVGNFVVYSGTGNEVTVTSLRSSTDYHFAVFEYNDNDTKTAENYLTTAIGKAWATTLKAADFLALEENFSYTAATLLTDNGWTAHSGGTTNAIPVAATGLNYTGYGSSGIGNSAEIKANGQSIHRTFTPISPGTPVYVAFLVNVASSNATGDYFLHLGPSNMGLSHFRSRVYVRASSADKVQFSMSDGAPPQGYTQEYDLKKTYLLVVKYTFSEAGTKASLFVNPDLQKEPAVAQVVVDEPGELSPVDINTIVLRQGPASPVLTLDGLRVATSYKLAIGEPAVKADQQISFAALEDRIYGAAPIMLTASTASNLPVSFSLLSGPATLNGNTLTLTGAGQVHVSASQKGNESFNAATDVDQTFCVNPTTPVVEVNGMELRITNPTEGTSSYVWYLNGTVVDGATTDAHTATTPGSYTVVAKAGKCMSQVSEAKLINPTGIDDEVFLEKNAVYPIPATTTLYIQVPEAGWGTATFGIYDLSGRSVLQQQEHIRGGSEVVMDVGGLLRGLYFLLISTPKGSTSRKIILH